MATRTEELAEAQVAPVSVLNEIAGALAQAQAEMQNPGFDSSNPHFRSKFASLAAVRNAVIPVLAKHGISLCQNLFTRDNLVCCETILTHASGQQMRFGPLAIPAAKADAQGFGSAATYARRYSLMAVAGVVGDEDDDANAASGREAQRSDAKGDLGKNVPLDKALDQAIEMRGILESDVDEDVKALHVLDLHEALARDADLYVAASDQLAAKERSAWKAYVSAGKKAQHAPINGARG